MVRKENSEGIFLYQILACNYCEHLYEDTKNSSCYCLNQESPFHYFEGKKWSPKIEALPKKSLTSEQQMRGCEKIKFEAEPIPERIF